MNNVADKAMMIEFMDQFKDKLNQANNLDPWLYKNNRGTIKIDPVKLGQTILERGNYLQIKKNNDLTLYRYNDRLGLWQVVTANEIRKEASALVRDHWSNKEVSDATKYIMDLADIKDASETIDNVDPYAVHFKNGVYDIRTGEMRPNSPDNYLFYGRDYEIDTSNAPTPLTDKWLDESVKDAKTFLMEFIGFCFYRSYEHLQKFAILLSEGGDGKSTFFNWLREMIGPANTSTVRLNDLTNPERRFTLARLYAKLLNYYADIGNSLIIDPSLIKGITGDDAIDVENKGEQAQTIKPFAKQIFGANRLPSFKDTSAGFGRRPCIVPFYSIPDFRQRFDKKALYAEQPAFVYKCLQAFRKALQRGYFSETEEMERLRLEWIGENDIVQDFIDEYCELGKDYAVKKVYLYDTYKNYCYNNGYKPLSSQKLKKELRRFSVFDTTKRINGEPTKAYIGIKLRSITSDELAIMQLK